jgi:hypothetical protein
MPHQYLETKKEQITSSKTGSKQERILQLNQVGISQTKSLVSSKQIKFIIN